ncbi:uncharacterized protein si:ch211-110p13.9 isoform X2 [Syngnathus acus]|uniref:uncharacterized protein si:ch211-110p13.9 isoform X2 n=1 Tax=Syngnathus acus TaxID=161584 RepID=UPI0018864039|nr:uncharacterized protein si:ch211-110p13.9 isoform X2 [Syngnathus acus]
MSNFRYLSLPHRDVGSRKIRYLYLANESAFTLTDCHQKSVPLFLGADLLAKTDVRSENHPRHHAKFARKGLATKIHFSSAFRLRGLKVAASSNGLWFYTIHGLFRIAFEMYAKREQLLVVENFQDAWKSQMSDSLLKTSYSLCAQLDPLDSGSEVPDKQSPKRPDNTSRDVATDHAYSMQRSSQSTSQFGNKLQSLSDKVAAKKFTEHNLELALFLLEHAERCLDETAEGRDAAEVALADWLGRRFAAAHADISRRVEAFKERHIQRIGELPPAEELAVQLFPDAMRTLLLNWMGLSQEEDLAERQSQYPILLLILEFANHNLITGVAHVLYSTLICK